MKIKSKTIETVLQYCASIAIIFCFSSISNISYYSDRVKQHQYWIEFSDQMIRDEIKYDSISKTEKIDTAELYRILDFKGYLKETFESKNAEYLDKQLNKIKLLGLLSFVFLGISLRVLDYRLKKSQDNSDD